MSNGDDERPALEYAGVNPEPDESAPWWVYVRDVAVAVLMFSAFAVGVVYLAKCLGL